MPTQKNKKKEKQEEEKENEFKFCAGCDIRIHPDEKRYEIDGLIYCTSCNFNVEK